MQGFLRNKDFILRKEYFGGIGFNKRDAITLELDEEAYFLLRILEDPLDLQQIRTRLMYHFNRGFSDEGLQLALKDLVDYNCVDIVETVDYSPERDLADYPVEGYLSAPETVHLSITSRCNRDCPFCYEGKEREEMETDQILRLVDELSSLRVFQLAIGGGEPLLRGDLLEIVQHCNDRNIVPNLTTNGSLLTKSFIEELSGRIGKINISFNECLNKGSELKDLIRILNKEGIKTGVNLLVTHEDIPNISRIIPDLAKLPVDDIVVLRAKPGKKVEWFNENKLRRGNLETLKRVLETHRERVRVDCSLVCLMRHTLPKLLQRNAVYGCVAGVRFCTIKSDGDVFPCSFFDGKEYCAGNVLEKGFRDIWNGSTVFKKFRAMNQMLQGACKSCGIREYCKGCRRIAVEESGDFYSQEILCS